MAMIKDYIVRIGYELTRAGLPENIVNEVHASLTHGRITQQDIEKIEKYDKLEKMVNIDNIPKYLAELTMCQSQVHDLIGQLKEATDNLDALHKFKDELKSEIKQLKEEKNSLLLNFDAQSNNFESCVESWNKLKQDSKKNQEIVDRLKEWKNKIEFDHGQWRTSGKIEKILDGGEK